MVLSNWEIISAGLRRLDAAFFGISGVPRATIRQMMIVTPAVRKRWTHPGALKKNVAMAQPTSITIPAIIPRSID